MSIALPLLAFALLFQDVTVAPGPKTWSVWIVSDPHVDPKSTFVETGFAQAVEDTRGLWDFALLPGDILLGQDCPGSKEGSFWSAQMAALDLDPSRIYSLAGNHDSDPIGLVWFARWVDPLGQNTKESRVDPKRRPFPIEGELTHYAIVLGNLRILMLSDWNAGGPPFGRTCASSEAGGYPAGRHLESTYKFWLEQVQAHSSDVLITVTHQSLFETTIYTGFYEGGGARHGTQTWADEKAGAIVYAIGDETIDGLGPDQEPLYEGKPRPYGYRWFLERNPGAIDLWLAGHTHAGLFPGKVFQGRSDVEQVDETWFVNAGSVANYPGAPAVRFSRFLEIQEGSTELKVRTFLHAAWNGHEKGFLPEADLLIETGVELRIPSRAEDR